MAATKQKNFKMLGDYLKQKRQLTGLTQAQVAKKLGYTSPQFLSDSERGLASLPLNKLRILLDLYQIPVGELTEVLIQQQRLVYKTALNEPRTHKEAKTA